MDEFKKLVEGLPDTLTPEELQAVYLAVVERFPPEMWREPRRMIAKKWKLDGAAVSQALRAMARQIKADGAEPKAPDPDEPPYTRDKQGAIKSTVGNAILMLADWPIAYDEFRDCPVWNQDPPWDPSDRPSKEFKPGQDVTDEDTTRLQSYLSRRGITVGGESCARILDVLADRRRFHRIREWLTRLKWDQTPRVHSLLHRYAGCEDVPYTRIVSRIATVSAVARIMAPGAKVDTMVILEGPQGLQKSTWIRTLFGAANFSDSISELGSKDSYQDLRGKWCIELAELDHLNRVDANRAKQFISKQSDTYRPSYGRRTRDVPRQCCLWGSTNAEGEGYFKDPTGNRRYLPVRCGSVAPLDIEGLGQDRLQIWAEAVHLYQSGVKWWPTSDDLSLVEAAQEERRMVDPWEDRLSSYLGSIDHPTVTTTYLLRVLGVTIDRAQGYHSQKVGSILKSLGWTRNRRTTGSRERYYLRPGAPEPSDQAPLDPPESIGTEDTVSVQELELALASAGVQVEPDFASMTVAELEKYIADHEEGENVYN